MTKQKQVVEVDDCNVVNSDVGGDVLVMTVIDVVPSEVDVRDIVEVNTGMLVVVSTIPVVNSVVGGSVLVIAFIEVVPSEADVVDTVVFKIEGFVITLVEIGVSVITIIGVVVKGNLEDV